MRYLSSFMIFSILGVSLLGCSGDGNINTVAQLDIDEPTTALFNPGTSVLPIPNDILFSRQSPSDGTMYVGDDLSNPVIAGIDALDGNSVSAPFDIPFSGSLDREQVLDAANFKVLQESIVPNPNQNVFLLPLSYPSDDPLSQASVDIDGVSVSVEVPTFAEALVYQGAVATGNIDALLDLAMPTARAEIISLDGGVDNVLRITPLRPLAPKTKYLVVLTDSIVDSNAEPVAASISYTNFKNQQNELIPSLEPLKQAVQGWERLAAGYFGFKQAVYDSAGVAFTAPSSNNIVFSLTFTTGGTTDVLTSVAAPETFFERSFSTLYKQRAIVNLVTGVYNLSGDNSSLSDETDSQINTTINALLTTQTSPLYSASLAGAIAAGANYSALSADASAAFIMQKAAAQAAVTVQDVALTAVNMVGALAGIADADVSDIFAVPKERETRFFRVDDIGDINPLFAANESTGRPAVPAKVYQGEITLPMFQALPELENSGSEIQTSRWIADENIGTLMDTALELEAGTARPSDMVTYRFPFPDGKTAQGTLNEVTSPVTAILPNADIVGLFGVTKPEAGWPVVIYVHGIGRDRSNALPLGAGLSAACINSTGDGPSGAPCYATVFIDQPLHGIGPNGSSVPGLISSTNPNEALVPNIGDNLPSASLTERHYDYTASATGAPTPMNYDEGFGTSGSLFVNLTNFSNARDNLRQMSIDLMNLAASIDSMDINGDGISDDIDPDNVYFIGHSLGAVDGIPFVAINNSDAVQNSPFSNQPFIKAGAFLMTGAGLPRLLTNSPSFAPGVLQGLAAASDALKQGQSGLESYLSVFQGVFDSIDPLNFASLLSDANGSTGVFLAEVVGDGSDTNLGDQTISNALDPIWGEQYGPLYTELDNGFVIDSFAAPLSGTEPLIYQFDAENTADVVSDGDAAVLVTRFTQGSHGTPVSSDNPSVFFEMLTQIVTFFASDGDVDGSIITDTSLVE